MKMSQHEQILSKTGKLFGDLWWRYDDDLFNESVKLFYKRFEANGFDLRWFCGKKCLDAGCGGGRYAIAMAKLGAEKVTGCDISTEGLADARRRAVDLPNVEFQEASVLELPYADEAFDFVCCSGVLHHTKDPEKGIQELARVLRPLGKIFLLIYGAGGLRWPTIMTIRPHAQAMGYGLLDEAMKLANLPPNKQRTFLDDFFVPIIQFYSWNEVQSMLVNNGLKSFDRWEKGKLDHEESVSVQKIELTQIRDLFKTAIEKETRRFKAVASYARNALNAVEAAIERLDAVEAKFAGGQISESDLNRQIFGEGHHRVLAEKD
jgi:ubiquinone/menaquinone biosynthesis C-methylase UbiE